jgi:oxygen-independent coproporphyrinogen-3 oxidase
MLMMGLRLREGVSVSRFESLARQTLDPGKLQALKSQGLIEVDEDRLRTTLSGTMVLNAVLRHLLDTLL